MARLTMLSGMAILSSVLLLAGCGPSPTTKSEPPPAPNSGKSGQLLDKGSLLDEAQRVERDAATLPQADEDYFHDMDNGIALTPEEIKGRNMWLVWTGGNDRFWNELIKDSFGSFDLLKTISSAPDLPFSPKNEDWPTHAEIPSRSPR